MKVKMNGYQQRCFHPEGALLRLLKCEVMFPRQRNAFPFSMRLQVGGCTSNR